MEGKPMYVESLISEKELKECANKFSTYNSGGKKVAPLPTTEQKWRYKMGASFTKEEVTLWNKNLKLLIEVVKELNKEK